MKRLISAVLTALVVASLAACGSGQQAAAPAPSTQTPTPTKTQAMRAVPDVTGKPFLDARSTLWHADFNPVTFVGPDGKKWGNSAPDEMLKVVSSKPAAGQMTDATTIEVTVDMTEGQQAAALDAKAAAYKLSIRYELRCGSDYSASAPLLHSYKEVWSSNYYKGSEDCTLSIGGKDMYGHVPLLPQEQAIVDTIGAHGGDISDPSGAFGAAYKLCAKVAPDYADQTVARMDWKKADAIGALALCPDAPHAAVLQEVVNSIKVGEGTYTVGKEMDPGTYQTRPGVKDCYWSRTNGGGGIIANDMVGFAPNGVTVTVYPGEGFESERCGTWTKIG